MPTFYFNSSKQCYIFGGGGGGGGQPHFTSFGQPKKAKLGWGKMR